MLIFLIKNYIIYSKYLDYEEANTLETSSLEVVILAYVKN